MILSLATMAMLLAPSTIQAQNFDDYFVDKTLRVDYTFAGNKKTQMIAVDQLNVMPRWYDKHQRLAELPVEGNGQITVRDHRTGKVIYATPSLPSSRNGSPTRNQRRTPRASKTYSSCRCQRIR